MSDRTLVDAAKASVIAYNEKNWDAVRRTVTPGIVYDEVATNRRAEGIENVLTLWKGWAAALPDSNATFENAYASGDAVVLELTWRGQHTGVLRTVAGEIPPTGKRIELRACQIVGIADGRTRSVRHYFDMATLLAQLGIATASAPAAKAAGA
jgi:steroid delta-isomerase-like uncharacterized protein